LQNPRISVVIPCFNQARYLGEAIDSVAAQTVGGVEVIVVDDGSTDETPAVAGRYPWIRYVRQENQGPGAARNAGLHASTGAYVVFLDADDRLLPHALRAGARSLDANAACAFTFGAFRRITADGAGIELPETGSFDAADPFGSLLRGNQIGMLSTVMFRRSALLAVGGFDATLMLCQDYDLFLRLARSFGVVRHGESVADYRQHDGNRSANAGAMLATVLGVVRSQREHVRGSAVHRRALRRGMRAWRDYYGERLLDRCREFAAAAKWRDALGTLWMFVRLCGTWSPAVLALHVMPRQPRAAMRGRRLEQQLRRGAWNAYTLPRRQLDRHVRSRLLPARVRHLHGPEAVDYGPDEVLAICVVRNGSLHVRHFVKHHLQLGVRHIVLLDNGSTDDTVQIAAEYPHTTVLQTDVPYRSYENVMKRYLARRFSNGRWNLCVDIDERFDFPFSGSVGLRDFIGYLNRRSFTAVLAQMLDLFADPAVEQEPDPTSHGGFRSAFPCYDISAVEQTAYTWGAVPRPDIRMHWGGVRRTLFGTRNGLTKAALVRVEPDRELFVDWHHAAGVSIADVTAVLLHYPFTGELVEKVRDAVRTRRYGMRTTAEYRGYARVLLKAPRLRITGPAVRRLDDIDTLLDEGFLVASEEWREAALRASPCA
jgi:glycosyltransferase involved in cell wall biosynthesis